MNPGSSPDEAAEPSATERRAAWSRYWQHGMPHSCVGTYGETYGGRIAEFWRDVFERLPAAARVLDIATGNGALARMLLAQRADATCDAVDIAAVQLPWLAALPPTDRSRVRLHPGVDAAALPFGAGTFDLVVSQYGFEYAELGGAIDELLRVRALQGGVAMVLHHADGRPASLARLELGHLQWLTGHEGFFDTSAALIAPIARSTTAEGRAALQRDTAAHAARERFNALQGELTARAGTGDGADVLYEAREAAMSFFTTAARQGEPAARQALAAYRQELDANATRLKDLCVHALDDDAARRLQERLQGAMGRPVALGQLREGSHLMGWTLRSE